MTHQDEHEWVRVAHLDALDEGCVKTVRAGKTVICLSKVEGKYGALDNHCRHQGGPLGEGSIEDGLVRCPWHGWEFHPRNGKAPGFDDGVPAFAVEEREDGVYVAVPRA
tara:strand:- start:8298 stop:8624 length:327 start_codon:yes stop_codon:yes gene_type:complete